MTLRSSSRTRATTTTKYFGCDTETYREERGKGLKSIQVYGNGEQHYFTADDWTADDDNVRHQVAGKFFQWLMDQDSDCNIAFFNMNFDVSQFLKIMVSELGLEFWTEPLFIPKGCIQILESERQLYLVQFRTFKGRLIRMIDLANFLVGVTLNKACKEWLGKEKVHIESKKFPKAPSSPIEIEYAMMDAQLTYELYLKLVDEDVIEGHKTVTVAGRTINHFKQFMKDQFDLSFNEYFFKNLPAKEIKAIKEKFEEEARDGVRGGNCQAYQKGVFTNCIHVDARSMYPTQMVRDFIPVGPLLAEKPNGRYTSLVYPHGYYTLKDNTVPCVQWRTKAQCVRFRYKSKVEPGDYVRDFYLDGSYPIWQEEYEIIKRCYDTRDEGIDKVWYIEMAENVILKPYIESLYKGKNENTGSKKLYYKLLLNSLYGKFLSRPDGKGIEYVCINGEWKRIKVETMKKVYYLPLGSWIAMMGRVTLMNAILSIDARDFLYCDTDSMIIRKPAFPDIKIGKWLGEWSVEVDDVNVNVVGPKTYQELKVTYDGYNMTRTLITKCGGLPTADKNNVKWLELKEGMVVHTAKPRRDPSTWAINFEEVDYSISSRASTFLSR